MPKYKLTNKDREKIVVTKRDCPCIKNTTLAYIFNCSPCRIGEILKADEGKYEGVNSQWHK
jgi:hypothetical protein